MEENKRQGKILWTKGGSGSDTTRLTIPVSWIKEMGITKEKREVELYFSNNTIIIKKIEEE